MLKYALEQRIFLYDSYVKQKQQTLPNNLKVLKYEDLLDPTGTSK
jgi:hypothetical protein